MSMAPLPVMLNLKTTRVPCGPLPLLISVPPETAIVPVEAIDWTFIDPPPTNSVPLVIVIGPRLLIPPDWVKVAGPVAPRLTLVARRFPPLSDNTACVPPPTASWPRLLDPPDWANVPLPVATSGDGFAATYVKPELSDPFISDKMPMASNPMLSFENWLTLRLPLWTISPVAAGRDDSPIHATVAVNVPPENDTIPGGAIALSAPTAK